MWSCHDLPHFWQCRRHPSTVFNPLSRLQAWLLTQSLRFIFMQPWTIYCSGHCQHPCSHRARTSFQLSAKPSQQFDRPRRRCKVYDWHEQQVPYEQVPSQYVTRFNRRLRPTTSVCYGFALVLQALAAQKHLVHRLQQQLARNEISTEFAIICQVSIPASAQHTLGAGQTAQQPDG
jgi:hypothetical protein